MHASRPIADLDEATKYWQQPSGWLLLAFSLFAKMLRVLNLHEAFFQKEKMRVINRRLPEFR